MKTEYSQLLKIKKHRVDTVESKLLELKGSMDRVLLSMEKIDREISIIKRPTDGTFSKMRVSFAYLSTLSNQKRVQKERLREIKRDIDNQKELYRVENIELQKIKYLHDTEVKNYLYSVKVKENRELDEIATRLFFRKQLGYQDG